MQKTFHSTLLALASVAALVVGWAYAMPLVGSGPAGAATRTYTATCPLAGETTPFTAVTLGSLPGRIATDSPFSLSGLRIRLTLSDSDVLGVLAGSSLGAKLTTDISTTGATPSSAPVTFTIPSTPIPDPAPSSVTFTGTAASPTFTSQPTAGTASVSTTASSTVKFTLNGGGVKPATCTNSPAPLVIASSTLYYPVPSVTGLSPSSGPSNGGNTVTVSGTGLDGATAVDFGTTPAADLDVVSSTELTVDAPQGTGSVDVAVTTPGGLSPTSSADAYSYSDALPAGNPVAIDSPRPSNLLTDASFENDQAAGWGTLAAGSGTVNYAAYTSSSVPEGDNYLEFNTSTAGGSVYQDVGASLSAGQSYTFSVWARNHSSSSESTCVVLWGIGLSAQNGQTCETLAPNSWTLISAPYDVSASGSMLRAQVYLQTPDANLDLAGTSFAADRSGPSTS